MKVGVDPGPGTYPLADAAGRVLRRLHPNAAVDTASTAAVPGTQAVARVRLALERRSRTTFVRRRLARSTAIAAAVAVASTAAILVWRRGIVDGGALVVLNGTAVGTTLISGTRLIAPAHNEINLGTADGTSLALEQGGALTVVEQSTTRRFSLAEGAVRAHVAKLAPHERFVIATEDAEIEVHGTTFRVATAEPDPACGGGTRTRVSVIEGVVVVRAHGSEARVLAGGAWPDGCESASTKTIVESVAPSLPPEPPRAMRLHTRAAAASRVDRTESSTATPASALAVQNDLLVAALRAKRQDRPREAERLLAELIERYPNGPLLETALAQRMRVLAPLDRRAAAAAATSYLARFPRGFAREEADRLASVVP